MKSSNQNNRRNIFYSLLNKESNKKQSKEAFLNYAQKKIAHNREIVKEAQQRELY